MNQHADGLPNLPPNKDLGITLLRVAAIYLLIGLSMGLAMGIANDFSLSSVHAHISLLGWATMSITGVVYIVMPACRESKLALLHFWGHNLGLPVMMISLVLLTYGFKGAEKMIAGGSTLVIASLLAFSINLFLNGGWHREQPNYCWWAEAIPGEKGLMSEAKAKLKTTHTKTKTVASSPKWMYTRENQV